MKSSHQRCSVLVLKIKSNISKRHAIYLPQKIVKHLNLKEGDSIEIIVVNSEIHIRLIPDPLYLALHGEKFAEIDFESVEEISEEEQSFYENTS